MGSWIMSATIFLTSLLFANQSQGATASYSGTCYFFDRGDNNGGNVLGMPCDVVEGGNVYSAFFHINWKDGTKTELNAKPDEPFIDAVTGRTFVKIGDATFIADDDGDVIIVD